jgi:GR25 family glycosyltransferase involved in LPS biosynthesis
MEHIYCINLKRAQERHDRMVRRFNYHGLNNRAIFVDAIDKNSKEIEDILNGFTLYPVTDMVKAEAACFQSHLKAISLFLETDDEWAIICEDDILLHNNFNDEFKRIMNNVPNDTNLVMLGHTVLFWNKFQWGGKNPQEYNLRPIVNDVTWGCLCYRIHRSFAEKIVKEFNHPFKDLEKYKYITSELIIKMSNGLLTCPPLVLDEHSGSYIRPEDNIDLSIVATELWGYFNYCHTEEVHVSKIYQEHEKKLLQIQRKYGKKRLLWISKLGYSCNYSYVAESLLPFLASQYDLWIFCTGVAYTEENQIKIAQRFNLSSEKISIIDKYPNNSNQSEDHEYFNNYFGGIYHLEQIVRQIEPNIILSFDDINILERQWELIQTISWGFKFEFIPYVSVHTSKIFSSQPVKKMLTMTNFAKEEIQKVCPETNIFVLPYIANNSVFYPLNNKKELREKYLNIDSGFVIGAIDHKRWDILLHAFGNFAQKYNNAILLMKILDMTQNLENLIIQVCQKYQIEKSRIKIIEGHINNVNELYNCCDLGLTIGEDWGLISSEMALCKIPQLVPDLPPFSEIFFKNRGLIPVKEYTSYVGRKYGKLPETLKDAFIPIIKSYIYHKSMTSKMDNINITEKISTICISPHGNNPEYKFFVDIELIAHFTRVADAIKFLQEYKYPDRLQILLGLNIEFLGREAPYLKRLYKTLPRSCRINYLLSLETVEKYWDLSKGSVGLVSVDDVVNTLEQFYKSPNLHKLEQIKTICDPHTIINQLCKYLDS